MFILFPRKSRRRKQGFFLVRLKSNACTMQELEIFRELKINFLLAFKIREGQNIDNNKALIPQIILWLREMK